MQFRTHVSSKFFAVSRNMPDFVTFEFFCGLWYNLFPSKQFCWKFQSRTADLYCTTQLLRFLDVLQSLFRLEMYLPSR